ncbi:carboxypeptidase-like regulatory domain-containing protein [Myxococcota bacterium]|nr:carboxypeptidase-like regulatory domain-containing protein [Myxococcota bacterium]
MRALLASLAAAASVLPAHAAAEERRAVIITSVVKDGDVLGEADAESLYDGAARTLVYALDVVLASKEEATELAAAGGVVCGSELTCLSRHLASAEVTELVELVEDLTVDPPLLSGQLVDTRRGVVTAREVVEVDRMTHTARTAAEALVARLVARAAWRMGGVARISVHPTDADLELTPPPVRSTDDGRTIVATAGDYVLHVEAPGFDPATRTITLRASSEELVDVQLEPRSLLSSPWLWAGVGVAVVGAGVALAFSLRSDELTLCQGTAAACGE